MPSLLLTRREQFIIAFAGFALVLGSGTAIWIRAYPTNPPSAPPHKPAAESSEARVYAYINGAVAAPGVYRLQRGVTLQSLIDAAGGLLPGADISALDLDARIVEYVSFTVPGTGPPSEQPAQDRTLVDLNRAKKAELETLPGVGPELAEAIMGYRAVTPFRSVRDLENVAGFGPKRVDALQHLVTVNL